MSVEESRERRTIADSMPSKPVRSEQLRRDVDRLSRK
jgi:hypothetical protein